jgi:hypothetical protein
MQMAKVTRNFFLALSLGLAMAAGAQNLDTSATDRSGTFDAPGKPTRGMTQQTVEANFGAPQNARQPIGDPPITRWEYANFVVFFEYDKVIHAVSK